MRGNAIHWSFNRACTIHAVDNLLVEHNVAFNVKGLSFFIEDGVEENNIVQYNLAVFTRQSNSLLNPDIQPGSFWIVKPNNIVHRNAVTGSTHFDYWFIVLQNPGGPSKTTSYCPTKAPIGRFSTIVPIVVVFMEFGYSLQKKRAVLPWLIPEKEDGVMDRTILQLPLETLLLGIKRLVWK